MKNAFGGTTVAGISLGRLEQKKEEWKDATLCKYPLL